MELSQQRALEMVGADKVEDDGAADTDVSAQFCYFLLVPLVWLDPSDVRGLTLEPFPNTTNTTLGVCSVF